MIVTCVYVHVKPDYIDSFIDASIMNHKGSVKESGNLRFDILQQADDPYRFMLYEAYESVEAAANHKTTDHYILWRDTVKDMMAEPRYGIRYDILEPKEISEW